MLPKPINLTAIFLAVLAVTASVSQFSRAVEPLSTFVSLLVHLIITVGLASCIFFFFRRFTLQKKFYANTLTTSLILFVVLAPPTALNEAGLILLTTLFAMVLKFFVSYKSRPIVNPAAGGMFTGLLVATVFFPDVFFITSWWGTSFLKVYELSGIQVNLSLFLLLFWIIVGLKPWRKYPAFLAFLAASLITFMTLLLFKPDLEGQVDALLFIFLDSTIYFFASIMLIEPKTSPSRKKEQYAFGAFVGVVFALLHSFSAAALPLSFFTSYYDLSALLLGNLCFVAYQYSSGKMQKSVPKRASL